MNISSYVSEATSHFFQMSPTSYPGLIWSYYLRYLWNYEPDSWIARISSFCRFLALLVSLPIIILGLLDITSYGIARTLGVIDDVKASTSDKATTMHLAGPTIDVQDFDSIFEGSDRDSLSAQSQSTDSISDSMVVPQKPREFFATGSNLKLSGVDVFSPAASRPSSPVLSRKTLNIDIPIKEEQPLRYRQLPRVNDTYDS